MPTQRRRTTNDDQPPVSLDLDTLEREGGPADPFIVQFQGKPMVFTDPAEIDWQDLIRAMTDPTTFFQTVMTADDADRFLAAKLPTWKLNEMMTKYAKHYGIPTPGNAVASLRR